MPIQVITQNGQKMYRYGDSGKLYADRKDAEKQAAAMYAAGYREPMKDMKDKKMGKKEKKKSVVKKDRNVLE